MPIPRRSFCRPAGVALLVAASLAGAPARAQLPGEAPT
ncbi:MAG: hypothetical protein AVDCRST_MAG11-3677, partial [uncultured Gemmatimonadaceae bacterium]